MKYCAKEKANIEKGKKVSTNQVEDCPPKRNSFYSLQ